MRQSGAAMLGIAEANGENRIEDAIEGVLRCPLLTEEHISNAKNFLFSISYGSEKKLKISELDQLTEKFKELRSQNSHVIWGRSEDPTLGDKIKLSVIISNYTTEFKENNAIGDSQGMFEGDKQQDAIIVDRGTTYTSPSSPYNMKSIVEENSKNHIKIIDDEFGFLKAADDIVTKKMVAEPEPVLLPRDVEPEPAFGAGTQKIRSTYEPKYEDDNQFDFLINTPAIQRLRQENKEEFQEKAIQNNKAYSFVMDDDFNNFFKDLPD